MQEVQGRLQGILKLQEQGRLQGLLNMKEQELRLEAEGRLQEQEPNKEQQKGGHIMIGGQVHRKTRSQASTTKFCSSTSREFFTGLDRRKAKQL